MTPMKQLMHLATPEEQTELATAIGTTRNHLYQLAGGHRKASADMAGRIEDATTALHKASRGRLPRIYRTDLCAACQSCEYARKCIGGRAIVSELPILT